MTWHAILLIVICFWGFAIPAPQITPVAQLVPRQTDPAFFGWLYFGTSLFSATCSSATYTQSGNYAGCCSSGLTCSLWSGCLSSSILIGPQASPYTCPAACTLNLIYESSGDTNAPRSVFDCATVASTYYRISPTSTTAGPTTSPPSASICLDRFGNCAPKTVIPGPTTIIVQFPSTSTNTFLRTTSTASASTSDGGSGGLSRTDKIALGTSLGVGIPAVLIALLAWCFPRLRPHRV